ncbi:MAG: patatin-like phospholipase family protein [Ardenticatenaceae bacterium]|nr:patatin-like phospholipase family protein [Ardenticatenaceae bacterium]
MEKEQRAREKTAVEKTAVGKKALVLAGGGVAGIAYELGVLHAIDRTLLDMSVNDFDIYVGTSAGATVAALLANGFTPGKILQAIQGERETRPFLRRDLWHFDIGSFWRAGRRAPGRLWNAGQRYWRDLRDGNLFGTLWVLLDLLPASLYDSANLEAYVRELIVTLGGSNKFEELERDLHIIATRLDTGQRAVFNRDGRVPISQAIAASSAVPGLYKPVRLNGIDYLDGGVRGNASIDLAVEQGATLVVCVNPIVPYDAHEEAGDDEAAEKGLQENEVSMQAVLSQTLRARIHATLHYHIKHLRGVYPEVDFYMIEPPQNDKNMSAPNLMRFSDRLQIARRAFESAVWQLAEDEETWRRMWRQHDTAVWPGLNADECTQVANAADRQALLSHLLDGDWPPPAKPAPHNSPQTRLRQALDTLDKALEKSRPTADAPSV